MGTLSAMVVTIPMRSIAFIAGVHERHSYTAMNTMMNLATKGFSQWMTEEITQMTDTIIFTRGVPPPEAFPTEQLVECFDAALRSDAAVVLQYGQQPGYTPLRRLLAEEYSVTERELMVAAG